MVPVLVLLFVALWFILRFMSYLVLFCSSVFSVLLALRLPRLGAFRRFVRFALVPFCLFPRRLGVCEGLRFVIVALPGLFSYSFLVFHSKCLYMSYLNKNVKPHFPRFGDNLSEMSYVFLWKKINKENVACSYRIVSKWNQASNTGTLFMCSHTNRSRPFQPTVL